jgi:hypothetical protein
MLIAQEYFEESVHLEQPVLPVVEPKLSEYYQTFRTRVPPLMDVSTLISSFVLFFLLMNFLSFYRTASPSLVSSLTEKMIELELRMKYPGEDLSEIDREYNVLSERLRALELRQMRDAEEARGIDLAGRWTQNELVSLATKFRSHKNNFNHFINEHFLPLQSKIFTQLPGCGCVEFFRLNPVPGGPTCSPTMGREFYTPFLPTPPHSTPSQCTPSSDDSVPSLWSVTDSKDDKGNEDF